MELRLVAYNSLRLLLKTLRALFLLVNVVILILPGAAAWWETMEGTEGEIYVAGLASVVATLFLCGFSAPISITHRAVEPCVLAATVYVPLVRMPEVTNDPIYSWLPLVSIQLIMLFWNHSLRKVKMEDRCWGYYLAIRSEDDVGASTAGKTTKGGSGKGTNASSFVNGMR
ncbi:hypothetical protein C8R44DRAFT_737721 [Mycena epipterygia]|nr:hypothetical protein C8R44DRAFT_737721 [Mycena epipterygia]